MEQPSFSSLKNLHPLIKEGTSLLISNRRDTKKLEECFKLFLQCADQFKDPQAYWRVSACFYDGIGTERDRAKSFEYALKAKEQGLIEGIFWLGVNCYWKKNYKEAYHCFHQLAQQGHLSSILWEGFLEYYEWGIKKNQENGRRKILHVVTSGDGYWTYVYSEILKYGYYGFPKDEQKTNHLKVIWEKQPIDEFNFFDPAA
jgi:TPR repeat protein